MSQTNELRKVVRSAIVEAVGFDAVYYQNADAAALYPHIVFAIDRVDLNDFNRADYRLIVDVWDKGDSIAAAEDLADAVCAAFNNINAPQDTILPTFFMESRREVLDPDKTSVTSRWS